MNYAPVKHSHVVPAGYLRAWAHGRQIAMRLVGSQNLVLVGVRDAGVRSDYYRRDRPGTGETIYDVEWSLAQGEDAALPVIADLPTRWPLTNDENAKVGQFMALQHLRGPAFRAWHAKHIADRAAELRAAPAAHAVPKPGMTPEATVESAIEIMESDTYRATRMLSLVRSVGIAMSSMHWTLVSFAHARLATSDHPVVVWPLRRGASRPESNDLDAGVLDTLEVFPRRPCAPAAIDVASRRRHPASGGSRGSSHLYGQRVRRRQRRQTVVPRARRAAVGCHGHSPTAQRRASQRLRHACGRLVTPTGRST